MLSAYPSVGYCMVALIILKIAWIGKGLVKVWLDLPQVDLERNASSELDVDLWQV
jgi:uncharacterized membrane protein